MKTTVLAGSFGPIGGVESFLCALLPELARRGFDCRLFCWAAGDPRLPALASSGIHVHRNAFRWGCRWALPDRLLLTASQSALLDCDVVLFGKPLPAAIHRRLSELRASRPHPRFVLVTPYRPAEMWPKAPPFLNSFDAIAVQAESFRTDLARLGYTGSVTVLPYIPPPCTPVASLPSDPLPIGYLGRLVPDKNLPYLLHVFAALLRRRPAVLNLFGDGPLAQPLRRFAAQLGIASAVRFHGRVTPEKVPAAIDTCSRFAFTSVTEGQCLAALEILCRGRPVVATPVGAFPEVLADPTLGSVAPLGDPDAFAESLLSLEPREPFRVQQAYAARFDRACVIDAYARWCQAA